MIGYRVDAIAACEILLEREFPLCIYSTLMLLLGSQCVYTCPVGFFIRIQEVAVVATLYYTGRPRWSQTRFVTKLAHIYSQFPPFGERERERQPKAGSTLLVHAGYMLVPSISNETDGRKL
jgi:hypothetical protein